MPGEGTSRKSPMPRQRAVGNLSCLVDNVRIAAKAVSVEKRRRLSIVSLAGNCVQRPVIGCSNGTHRPVSG
jgi:hypothetical protein